MESEVERPAPDPTASKCRAETQIQGFWLHFSPLVSPVPTRRFSVFPSFWPWLASRLVTHLPARWLERSPSTFQPHPGRAQRSLTGVSSHRHAPRIHSAVWAVCFATGSPARLSPGRVPVTLHRASVGTTDRTRWRSLCEEGMEERDRERRREDLGAPFIDRLID